MAIVTIAREIGALGEEVAQELSRRTGARLVERAYIEEQLAKNGIDVEKLARYDEKRPGFFSSLSQSREDYLHFLKTAVYKEAVKGKVIFVGRGAFAILGSVPGVLSAKIIAPKHVRVDRLKEFHRCDDRRAEQILNASDRDRQGFHSYFFGVNWKDADSYGMVLNTGVLSAPDAASILQSAEAAIDAVTDLGLQARRLEALNLSQDILTNILYTHRVPVQFLEADVQGSLVTLHGVASSRSSIEAALAAAREVRGVSEVISEIQIVQEYAALP